MKYGDNLAAPRSSKLFEGSRLLMRRIVGKRLITAFTDEDFVTSQLLQIIKPKKNIEIKELLAILNSKLMAYYFRLKYNRQEKTFPEIRIYELRSLPIKFGSEDVELRVSTVERAIEENSKISELIVGFQSYVFKKFELPKLSRKLESWHELTFADFLKELTKAIKATNKVRIKEGHSPIPELTKKDEFEWMELFEPKKKEAQELQAQITATEKEIDTMVYELYGLSDEEILIVEGSQIKNK